jgi:hypothetical protein
MPRTATTATPASADMRFSVPPRSSLRLDSASSHAFGLAPAIEYNWKPNLGVLIGTRVIPAGRNTAFTVTPAVAINYVH